MMDAKYLAEIKAREHAATKGPWSVDTNEPFSRQINGVFADKQEKYVFYHDPDGEDTVSRKNADFIAQARTDIPALVAEVEQANEACETACAVAREYCDKLVIAEKQIATLKKALELMAEYDYEEMLAEKEIKHFIQRAQEQEADHA